MMRLPLALLALATVNTVIAASAPIAVSATSAPLTAAPEGPAISAISAIETVTLPSPGSPLVSLRLVFRVGSIDDPPGKEGLAALSGLMLGQAGTAQRSYAGLLDALYPMAAAIEVSTDREVTVIAGEIHREKLADFTALFTEALLAPGFSPSDLERNREQLLAYLTTTLRAANDELLGLEALQQRLYAGHPYRHSPAGTVQGLRAITIDDVKQFVRQQFTRANLELGVAGGYPEGYVAALTEKLSALPAGERSERALPKVPKIDGRQVTIVEKNTDSVGIHFGHPLAVTRADADFYPLLVANSFLGEHRTFHGRLMQQLRGLRGLNYGDYSYIEYWETPPFTTLPSPNVPRRQQYFSVWVRPVVRGTELFALRAALFEVDRLIEKGMTREEFELTRDFLRNYSKLWAQTLATRLGFLMDSRFYGTAYFIDEIDRRLAQLTVEQVNAALRKHLQAHDLALVLVADEAQALKEALAAGAPSSMEYQSAVPSEVGEADPVIAQLPIRPAAIEIVAVEEMFEK